MAVAAPRLTGAKSHCELYSTPSRNGVNKLAPSAHRQAVCTVASVSSDEQQQAVVAHGRRRSSTAVPMLLVASSVPGAYITGASADSDAAFGASAPCLVREPGGSRLR